MIYHFNVVVQTLEQSLLLSLLHMNAATSSIMMKPTEDARGIGLPRSAPQTSSFAWSNGDELSTDSFGTNVTDDSEGIWSSITADSPTTEFNNVSYVANPGLPNEHQYVLIALYTATAALAVTGNLVVIAVLTVGRRSRTDLRAFLINLAVADLTMAVFCMPFTFTTTMLHVWLFGPVMCPIVLFVQVCRQLSFD